MQLELCWAHLQGNRAQAPADSAATNGTFPFHRSLRIHSTFSTTNPPFVTKASETNSLMVVVEDRRYTGEGRDKSHTQQPPWSFKQHQLQWNKPPQRLANGSADDTRRPHLVNGVAKYESTVKRCEYQIFAATKRFRIPRQTSIEACVYFISCGNKMFLESDSALTKFAASTVGDSSTDMRLKPPKLS